MRKTTKTSRKLKKNIYILQAKLEQENARRGTWKEINPKTLYNHVNKNE